MPYRNRSPFIIGAPNTPMAASYHEVTRKLTGGILQRLKSMSRPRDLKQKESIETSQAFKGSTQPLKGSAKKVSPLNLLKQQIHTELIREMDLKKDITNSTG